MTLTNPLPLRGGPPPSTVRLTDGIDSAPPTPESLPNLVPEEIIYDHPHLAAFLDLASLTIGIRRRNPAVSLVRNGLPIRFTDERSMSPDESVVLTLQEINEAKGFASTYLQDALMDDNERIDRHSAMALAAMLNTYDGFEGEHMALTLTVKERKQESLPSKNEFDWIQENPLLYRAVCRMRQYARSILGPEEARQVVHDINRHIRKETPRILINLRKERQDKLDLIVLDLVNNHREKTARLFSHSHLHRYGPTRHARSLATNRTAATNAITRNI